MNFIIDTSAYSEAQRGNQKVLDLLGRADHIFIPSIVEAELRAGFAYGVKKLDNNKLLDKFMNRSSVTWMNISERTPRITADLYAELRKTGWTIGQNDLWIAALAIENNLPILTLDADFGGVKAIELVEI